MSLSPVAFIAPNYRDFKGQWVKFYESGTTTAKTIYLDSAGSTSAAKVQIDSDGFMVSAGNAVIVPYVSGSYDAYIFDTEADADANTTVSAVRIADNILSTTSSSINPFDNVAEMKATPLDVGDTALCKRYYAGGELVDGLLFNIVVGGTGADDGGSYHGLANTNQAELVEHTSISPYVFGCVGDGVTNDQTQMQKCWDYAYLMGVELFIPKGVFLVDTIEYPPESVTEMRGDAFRVRGVGAGNVFVTAVPERASTLLGSGDAPVLRCVDRLQQANSNTGGAWDIEGIRVQANSDVNPAVKLDNMGEYSSFRKNEVYQAGSGDGVLIDYALKGNFEQCNILNRDYASYETAINPVDRVASGVRIKMPRGGGIFSLKKVTSRGFATGYLIGEDSTSSANMSGLLMEQCECSVVDVGIDIQPFTLKATIDSCYFEGVEGTHIIDRGTSTTVSNGIHFINATSEGGVTYLDSDGDTYGNNYHGNYFETSNDNDTLVLIRGNFRKSLENNHLVYGVTDGVNVTGVEVTGTNAKLNMGSNVFLPRGEWLGTDTNKIKYAHTGTFVGSTEAQNGSDFSHEELLGGIAFVRANTVLTESNVTSNLLTLNEKSNYYEATPSTPVSINQITFDSSLLSDNTKFIWINVNNANLTFTNSSLLKLAGGVSYNGIGSICFMVTPSGSNFLVKEVSRASYV